MSGFFSHSSSRRRYPDPNMGGAHYRRKGLFGMLSGLGSGSAPGAPGDTMARGIRTRDIRTRDTQTRDIRTRDTQIRDIRIRDRGDSSRQPRQRAARQ